MVVVAVIIDIAVAVVAVSTVEMNIFVLVVSILLTPSLLANYASVLFSFFFFSSFPLSLFFWDFHTILLPLLFISSLLYSTNTAALIIHRNVEEERVRGNRDDHWCLQFRRASV